MRGEEPNGRKFASAGLGLLAIHAIGPTQAFQLRFDAFPATRSWPEDGRGDDQKDK